MTAGDPTAASIEPARIRAAIPADLRSRDARLALALFTLTAGIYAASWVAIFEVRPLAFGVLAAILNGLFVGLLFVIGHDACHGAFLPWKGANALLGRAAFLPSLHPYAFWELGHNRVHHGWTNLKGKDYVWAPFAADEFQRLPWRRRALERVGRTFAGAGVHYAFAIWWPHMVMPRRDDRDRVAPGSGVADRLSVAAFVVAQALLGSWLAASRGMGPAEAWAQAIALGVIVPFGTFSWLIGVVTFVHHNHARVRWYDRREEWSFANGSLRGTVRAIPAKALESLLLHIMAHTAHHVDTHVPLYRLLRAQDALENAYPRDVIRARLTIAYTLGVFRRCKLYDYRAHAWLDFAGRPTGADEGEPAAPIAASSSVASS
jgi:omega-6 fatty acid desaturase (delta-12 desaturase)